MLARAMKCTRLSGAGGTEADTAIDALMSQLGPVKHLLDGSQQGGQLKSKVFQLKVH